MSALVIRTRSSVWTFDRDASTFTRRPRVADADHPSVAYADGPEPYVVLSGPSPETGYFVVIRPDGRFLASTALDVEEVPA